MELLTQVVFRYSHATCHFLPSNQAPHTNPNVSADDVAFLITASPSMPLRGLPFARGGRHTITSHARLITHTAYPLAAPPAARLTEQTRAPLDPCLCRYQKKLSP